MARLNLTLDSDTWSDLSRRAVRQRMAKSALARELLSRALRRESEIERRRRLAEDYVRGRGDARKILADLELAQLDLVDDDGDS